MTILPPPSILSEMMIDIYASKSKPGEITILYDKHFSPRLKHLEYNPATFRLAFVLEGGLRRDLGSAIQPLLQPHFEVGNRVLFMMVEEGVGKSFKPKKNMEGVEIISLMRPVESPAPRPRKAGESLKAYFSGLSFPKTGTKKK